MLQLCKFTLTAELPARLSTFGTAEGFFVASFRTHLGPGAFGWWGAGWGPLLQGLSVLALYSLILFWMYRRKLFLRI